MWPALAIFSVFWIISSRRLNRNTWPETIVTLVMQLGALLLVAWLFPGWVWKTVLLLYLTLPWWVVPVQVWRSARYPDSPDIQPYDPEQHPVPPQLRAAVERQARALEAAGLVRVAAFCSRQGEQMTALQVLLESPDGHEGALVSVDETVVCQGTPAEARIVGGDCTVAVRFADGRRLMVTSAPYDPTPRVPGVVREVLPTLRDPVQLLTFARAYRARFRADARTVPLRDGVPPLEYLYAAARRNWQAQVRAGRMRAVPEGGYGLTLWGALFLTLAQAPPFRQIAGARVRLRERRLLRVLGMAPPPASRERWWFRGSDVQGVAALAVALVLLLPVPPLSRFALPMLPATMAPSSLVPPARPYRLPDGFAVPADFPGAVRALEQLAGMASVPLEVEDAYTGELHRGPGVEVRFAADRTDSLIQAAGPLFRARGFLLFRHENTFGIGGEPEFVALYPRDDAAEVMRLVGTNGDNYGIGTDSVVAWFTELRARHPFVVTGISHDALEGRFIPAPDARQAEQLAREFHAFCPDVVTQGAGTVRKLADEIRRGTLYCWWD
ncbi:MAG TPA: DUF4253 domain-containing protein [Longimicrobium sp.]